MMAICSKNSKWFFGFYLLIVVDNPLPVFSVCPVRSLLLLLLKYLLVLLVHLVHVVRPEVL